MIRKQINTLLNFCTAIFMVFSLMSCKKTYNCECTFKTFKTVHPLPKETKKDATKACSEINIAWQDADGNCTLAK